MKLAMRRHSTGWCLTSFHTAGATGADVRLTPELAVQRVTDESASLIFLIYTLSPPKLGKYLDSFAPINRFFGVHITHQPSLGASSINIASKARRRRDISGELRGDGGGAAASNGWGVRIRYEMAYYYVAEDKMKDSGDLSLLQYIPADGLYDYGLGCYGHHRGSSAASWVHRPVLPQDRVYQW